jgi:hypothetical protein
MEQSGEHSCVVSTVQDRWVVCAKIDNRVSLNA